MIKFLSWALMEESWVGPATFTALVIMFVVSAFAWVMFTVYYPILGLGVFVSVLVFVSIEVYKEYRRTH